MILLEHDAKVLLEGAGIPVPAGVLFETPPRPRDPLPGSGPWMVKAQVPVGGRGLVGGIRAEASPQSVADAVASMLGSRIRGHCVSECRVEGAVQGAAERYVSLSLDPGTGTVRVLVADHGGAYIERSGALVARQDASLDEGAVGDALTRAAARLAPDTRLAIEAAAPLLARAFLGLDATLLEINPLFVRPDGSWVAGDAKVTLDDNALPRQPAIRRLLEARRATYPDLAFKVEHGFDFLVLDEQGDVGLLTTGAGLSMQLVEELAREGLHAYDFCDVRTGQMRGDPTRLVHVMERLAAAPALRCAFVNIFAGITDLAEFATLVRQAVDAVPALRAPLVIRLEGPSFEHAVAALDGWTRIDQVHRSLDAAIAEVRTHVRT